MEHTAPVARHVSSANNSTSASSASSIPAAGVTPALHAPAAERLASTASRAHAAHLVPVAKLAATAQRAPDTCLADVEAAPRPPTSTALEHTPVATVITSARESIDRLSPPARAATREVNRELRIGDIFVELGEPLLAPKAAEHAGSLLAVIPRPSLRPRRRL